MAATARIVCISCLTLFPLSGGTACVVRISLFWLAATWMATTARIISISCIILSTMQGVTARIISISWLGGFGWQRRHASSELAASDFHLARGHGAHHQHQLVRFHAMARIISIQTLHIVPGAAARIISISCFRHSTVPVATARIIASAGWVFSWQRCRAAGPGRASSHQLVQLFVRGSISMTCFRFSLHSATDRGRHHQHLLVCSSA